MNKRYLHNPSRQHQPTHYAGPGGRAMYT